MDNRTFVSLPAASAIKGLLQEAVAGQAEQLDVLARWSDIVIDAPASQATLVSNALSTDGLVGVYTGQVTFPYPKRDLGALLPYPLIYPIEYPTTFVRLATYLQQTYGICLEDGEFAIANNSQTTPLESTDPIDALPDALTGAVTLVAQATSGRFVTGSKLYISPTAEGVAFPFTSIAKVDSPLDFHLLTDHF